MSNRVMDTVGRIPAFQWRHVPTASNPADVASRGMAPAALIEFQLWWQGPPWLLLPPLQWPCKTSWRSQRNVVEMKPVVLIATPALVDLTKRFSNYTHCKRIVTWCRRFMLNCWKSRGDRDLSTRLSLAELEQTHVQLLKLSQGRSFRADRAALACFNQVPRQSSIANPRPYLDSDGLLGRLKNSTLTPNQKHPIIRTDSPN